MGSDKNSAKFSSDIPCTFDRGFCDWRSYPVSRFGGIALNKKWYYGNSVYDHTYSGNGEL